MGTTTFLNQFKSLTVKNNGITANGTQSFGVVEKGQFSKSNSSAKSALKLGAVINVEIAFRRHIEV